MTEPLIRGVSPGDFEAVAALTNHFILKTSIHFGTEPVTAAELRGSWEKSQSRYPFLVIESNGRFAGYAKAGVWRERAAYAWTPETGIYLEEHARGSGLGVRLYSALIQELQRRGFQSAVAGITLPNAPSVRLHERCGFVHVGTVTRAGFKVGQWYDVGFWQVMLDPTGSAPRPLPS